MGTLQSKDGPSNDDISQVYPVNQKVLDLIRAHITKRFEVLSAIADRMKDPKNDLCMYASMYACLYLH